jgi:hypothetical protein
MLNVILAPIGLLLIALGAWGLYVATRASRRREAPDRSAKPSDEAN